MHELRGSLGTVHRNRGGGQAGDTRYCLQKGLLGRCVRSGGRQMTPAVVFTIVVTGRVFEELECTVLNSCDRSSIERIFSG